MEMFSVSLKQIYATRWVQKHDTWKNVSGGCLGWRFSTWNCFKQISLFQVVSRFFFSLCFTALTCHLAFWGGGGWGEMTLAGEPVPKSSQLWQSEAETGNKSTWMEEIDFSRREIRLTLPGGISFLGCLLVQSALHSSMHSLYAFVVWCDIIRDWLQT